MGGEGEIKGHLFNIQRFSLDDGPGIRSTVFLKGCNQHCAWCHNPESLRTTPQLMRKHSICTGCGVCVATCPRGANRFAGEMEGFPEGSAGSGERLAGSGTVSAETGEGSEPGQKVVTTSQCIGCGTCVPVCPVQALKIMGYTMTVEEAMKVIRKDRAFYDRSGGGVTFSGGEPTCQGPFLLAMLDACGAEGIHRAIETNGNASPDLIKSLSSRLEYVMIDLKHADDAKHRAFTGASNARTLESIRWFLAHNETQVRIPVIPGFNDTPGELQQMLDLLSAAGAEGATLLPYHTFGISKYESLSMAYPLAEREATSAETVAQLLGQTDPHGMKMHIK